MVKFTDTPIFDRSKKTGSSVPEFVKISNSSELPFNADHEFIILKVSLNSCPPCKSFKEELEKTELKTPVTIFELNGPDDRDFCSKHEIRSVPFVVLFTKDGKKVNKGVCSSVSHLREMVREGLSVEI